MSLTARIPLPPSRQVGAMELAMPLGGLCVASATAILRWPAAAVVWIALAGAAAIAFLVAGAIRSRRARRMTIAVSARGAIDLSTGAGELPGTWRLAESTVAWPAFAMVALASDDAPRVALRRAVVAAELPSADRWALRRFLTWSLRARDGAAGTGKSASR